MEEPIKNPPQPPSMEAVTTNTKKRPLENDAISHNSKHLKLRVILRDLRPHFLQVLRTSDFRNCKVANEIREQMKLLVDLYNGKTTTTENHTFPVKNKDAQKLERVKTPEHLPPEGNKIQTSSTPEKPLADADDGKGTYIVGGSAFGWNFVTFSGKDPVYYGVTKDTFRSNSLTTVVTPP